MSTAAGTVGVINVRLSERLMDVAIAAFLWTFRIGVVFIVVVGSILTIASGRYNAETWVNLTISGLTLGSIYALIALGYTMVYGILRMINFAHGEIFMVGAFAGYFVATGLASAGILNAGVLASLVSIGLMILVAMLIAAPVTLLVERIAYRPLRNAPRLVPLISAIGASYFIQYSVRGFFGPGVYSYPAIDVLNELVPIGIIRIRWVDVLVIGSALAMMAGLYLFVMRTRTGTAVRAVSEDKAAAALMGINVNRSIVVTFALGAIMAGAGGVLYALLFRQVDFDTGFIPGLKAFTAAVLGGIGNIPGAMLGGLFLGLVESLGPTLFLDGFNVPSANQLKDVIAFTMLVMILVFRPSGLLGERVSRTRA
jgi:branched-chain amino acid transport system permease protein